MKMYYVRVGTGFCGAFHEFEIEAETIQDAEREAIEAAIGDLDIEECYAIEDADE